MSAERTRRPISLEECAADLAALRGGSPAPRALVHVAAAAEHALRRLLRDDPTASVELRLRALAPEELPLSELLAELRRRDRIPVELAAGMHELATAAQRAEQGGEIERREAATGVAVADALEAHLSRGSGVPTLEDPLLDPEPEASLTADDGELVVHPVPPEARSRRWPWLVPLVGLAAVIALAAWAVARAGEGSRVRRADQLAEAGRTAEAATLLREALRAEPADAGAAVRLARLYRDAGRPTEALRVMRDGLAAAPDHPRLHEELGLLLLDDGRPADAVRAFRSALGADSTSERAWIGMARALRAAGDPAAAERLLARAPEAARVLAGPAPPAARTSAPAPPPATP